MRICITRGEQFNEYESRIDGETDKTTLMNKQKKNLVKAESSIYIYIEHWEFKRFFFPSRRFELFRRVIDSYIINIFDEEPREKTM